MSNRIGSTLDAGLIKYFYRLSRDDEGYLTFTKVNLALDNETIVIDDPEARADEELQSDFGGFDGDTLVINMDANHNIINKSMGYSQYKVRPDDLLYFINDDGEMVVRINGTYSYPATV
jgi:hypothetical protein